MGFVLSLGTWCSQASAAGAKCAPVQTAPMQVADTMSQLLSSMRTEDLDGFEAVTTADFYAYDGGQRFTGRALFELIKQGHAAGKKWQWSVTEPSVHVSCNLAWISYVNRGSVEDASGRQTLAWLESAVLEFDSGQWRIHFVHSTRAAQ
jgi:hypothetical protein